MLPGQRTFVFPPRRKKNVPLANRIRPTSRSSVNMLTINQWECILTSMNRSMAIISTHRGHMNTEPHREVMRPSGGTEGAGSTYTRDWTKHELSFCSATDWLHPIAEYNPTDDGRVIEVTGGRHGILEYLFFSFVCWTILKSVNAKWTRVATAENQKLTILIN